MINKEMTVREKRAELRKYYEQKYQNYIQREYDNYYLTHKRNVKTGRDDLHCRIHFIVREKNLRLVKIDQASPAKIKKLYQEIFNAK